MKLTNEEIEKIIMEEIEVDCYDEHEADMGWYIFMSENLNYPFEAEYPLKSKDNKTKWEKVEVIDSETTEDDFNRNEFYVVIEFGEFRMPGRLSKLRNIQADEETLKALKVWKNRNKF